MYDVGLCLHVSFNIIRQPLRKTYLLHYFIIMHTNHFKIEVINYSNFEKLDLQSHSDINEKFLTYIDIMHYNTLKLKTLY